MKKVTAERFVQLTFSLPLEQLDAVHERRGIGAEAEHGHVEIRSGRLTAFAGRDDPLMIAQAPATPAGRGEDKVVAIAREDR